MYGIKEFGEKLGTGIIEFIYHDDIQTINELGFKTYIVNNDNYFTCTVIAYKNQASKKYLLNKYYSENK